MWLQDLPPAAKVAAAFIALSFVTTPLIAFMGAAVILLLIRYTDDNYSGGSSPYSGS